MKLLAKINRSSRTKLGRLLDQNGDIDSVRSVLRRCLFLAAAVLLMARPVAAAPGAELVVASQLDGTEARGALFAVDLASGRRRILSDLGDPAQGPIGQDIGSVTVDAKGRIFVTDLFGGSPAFGGQLFEVDRNTGTRRLIANFGQGAPSGPFSFGLDVDRSGFIVAATNFDSVVMVNSASGERSLVSSTTDAARWPGAVGRQIQDLALNKKGGIVVTSHDFSQALGSAVHVVDPSTGNASLVSDFADSAQGTDVSEVWANAGIAIERSGAVLLASGNTVAAPRSLLFRIDPRTGRRSVLSDFDRPDQGPTGVSPRGLALEPDGGILLLTTNPSTGEQRVMRVNPVTGRRQIVSEPANLVQGPAWTAPTSIAVLAPR